MSIPIVIVLTCMFLQLSMRMPVDVDIRTLSKFIYALFSLVAYVWAGCRLLASSKNKCHAYTLQDSSLSSSLASEITQISCAASRIWLLLDAMPFFSTRGSTRHKFHVGCRRTLQNMNSPNMCQQVIGPFIYLKIWLT